MSKKQYAFCLTISAILAAAGIILVATAFTQPPAYLCLPAGLLLIIFSIMGALASKQRTSNTRKHRMDTEYTSRDIIKHYDERLDRISEQLDRIERIYTSKQPKKAYSVKEFATMYSLSIPMVKQLIARGKLKAATSDSKRGSTLLIDAKSAETWWTKQLGKKIN